MQPELFEELQTEPPSRWSRKVLFPHRFLRVRVAYEDLFFAVLSSLLILLAGFCLGVERGKRLVTSPTSMEVAPLASVPKPTEGISVEKSAAVLVPVVASPRPASIPGEGNRSFAIQLASFLDTKVAERERQRLRKRGFDAQVVKQGRYFELRVVGFGTRVDALGPLAILRKSYRDAFIKRLSP